MLAHVWFCGHCHQVTEAVDAGDAYPQCERCGSRRLTKHELAPEPPEPRRAQKRHRLPAEKRDLRVLVRDGYWFCNGCLEVTERTEEECCCLCGSSNMAWQEPALKEDVA